MKILASFVILAALTGCAAIDKVSQFWPRDHDTALVSAYIYLEKGLEKASCGDTNSFSESLIVADWMHRYSDFRKDPQTQATKNIFDNLKKASVANEAVCKRFINITKINMDLVKESWSKR